MDEENLDQRIEGLLDQLDNRALTRLEIEAIESKVAFLQGLKPSA